MQIKSSVFLEREQKLSNECAQLQEECFGHKQRLYAVEQENKDWMEGMQQFKKMKEYEFAQQKQF